MTKVMQYTLQVFFSPYLGRSTFFLLIICNFDFYLFSVGELNTNNDAVFESQIGCR